MIILDASVLIGFLDSEDNHHRAAVELLTQAADDDLAANSLTMAEALGTPARRDCLPIALAALRDLEVRELPFPGETAVRLARLRGETGLKMPDCCVLLAAQDAAASIATFDERLKRAAAATDVAVFGC